MKIEYPIEADRPTRRLTRRAARRHAAAPTAVTEPSPRGPRAPSRSCPGTRPASSSPAFDGPARPAALPDPARRDRHPRHPDRAHHAPVHGVPGPDAGAEPGRGGRVHGDGGHAHPHQVEDAGARSIPPRRRATRSRRTRARRWCSGCSSSSATRRRRACSTSKGADPRRHLDAARHRAARASTTPARRCWRPGLFDLISAFKELLERRKTLLAHEVESEGKTHRAAHGGAARAGARGRVAGLPRAVRGPGDQGRHDRDLPGPARADPAQAREGLPAGHLRRDPRVPAGGARRRRRRPRP